MSGIPFFYYDIVARIFPGGITLAILAFTVDDIRRLLSGPESWKAALVPLALTGASYMIGVLFEVLFPDWLVWTWVSDRAFKAVAEEYPWSEKMKRPDPNSRSKSRAFRDQAWFDLILAGKKDEAQAFAHALRFWAEAKMCLHSFLPVVAAAIIFYCRQKPFWTITAAVVAALLLWGVYSRDRRRWMQILPSIERLRAGEANV